MPKIITSKGKKEFVKELNREVTVIKPQYYFVEDLTKDFQTKYGMIKKADLKKKDGSILKSSAGKEFSIFTPDFIDTYKRINRSAQIITLKDIGIIISFTGINKNSVVVDAGAGSGALACFLAHVAKQVTTYEVNKEFIKVVKQNISPLNLKNLKVKNKSIYTGIDEKDVDLITLDLPQPWNAIESANKALKVGGYIVNYSPCITSSQDFVNTISKHSDFTILKTIELMERTWKVEGKAVRPKTESIGHTGFLTFCRKIR